MSIIHQQYVIVCPHSCWSVRTQIQSRSGHLGVRLSQCGLCRGIRVCLLHEGVHWPCPYPLHPRRCLLLCLHVSIPSVIVSYATARGHSFKLAKTFCKHTFTQYCFTYRNVSVWNSMPEIFFGLKHPLALSATCVHVTLLWTARMGLLSTLLDVPHPPCYMCMFMSCDMMHYNNIIIIVIIIACKNVSAFFIPTVITGRSNIVTRWIRFSIEL